MADEHRNGGANDLILDELPPGEAGGRVQAIYDEIRAVLRVPSIDTLWLALARRPDALDAVWRWLAPLLGSVQCEDAARELRHAAVIELALGLPAHKAFRGDMSRTEIGADDRARISNFNMAEHYVLPKLLLAATMLGQEIDGAARPIAGGPLAALPRGVAAGAPNVPPPLDPEQARGEIPGLFAEIRAAHGYPQLSAYFRVIAQAGDFLRIAWNALRPVVGDPLYVERVQALTAQARELGDGLRARAAPLALPAATAEAIRPTIVRFAEQIYPETLIEVTVIKGLTDGPQAAAANSYSLAAGDGESG